MQFRRHDRRLVSRVEDRKYYQNQNGKLTCVAKNKGQGRTGQTDPSLDTYREEHGDVAVSQLIVGKRGKGKIAIRKKDVPWTPGDVVRYKGQRKVVKGSRSYGSQIGFVGEKEYVKSKNCVLIYRNQGMVAEKSIMVQGGE